ncbi:MAG: zinc ribbon domain-containing protein [Haloarculaceae archaeon]
MSKITFRADDELIEQLEAFDASKSEVMREALRTYLDGVDAGTDHAERGAPAERAADPETLDELVAERVDALITDRLERAFTPREPRDVNVNITLDGDSAVESQDATTERKTTTAGRENASDDESAPRNTREDERKTCAQCGENVGPDHVYCPNCGEKTARRVFCECGDELRSDWAFCPSCGRRTPAADVLDSP